ncbi:hypothetical protein DPMN_099643 [Dreissena polymorpha]|uniref:Uncharacterized protein n=1 Tax=Dreissena polymorpha TaxID=45954 RepID=A0A9D4LFB4_DREPO|nr:hypothetical protein DPMN_099643 [Dreissena polymorpha]
MEQNIKRRVYLSEKQHPRRSRNLKELQSCNGFGVRVVTSMSRVVRVVIGMFRAQMTGNNRSVDVLIGLSRGNQRCFLDVNVSIITERFNDPSKY